MHAPQIVTLALMALSLGFALAKDGEPRTDKHSFGWQCISSAVTFWLLWWGGFWG